jgi:hypothetical protein
MPWRLASRHWERRRPRRCRQWHEEEIAAGKHATLRDLPSLTLRAIIRPVVLLRIRVQPNARRNEIVRWEEHPRHGRLLHVRITAPPVDGQANAVLTAFLAERLRLPKFRVTLLRGGSFRVKTFEIPDETPLPP